MLSGSRFGFFNNGVTSACFMQRGTTHDVKEELISCVINGANPSVTCFSSNVASGLSAQDVVGDLVMSLRISTLSRMCAIVEHWDSAARPHPS